MALFLKRVVLSLVLLLAAYGQDSKSTAFLRGSRTGNITNNASLAFPARSLGSSASCSCCQSDGSCPGGGSPCNGAKNREFVNKYNALLDNPTCLGERLKSYRISKVIRDKVVERAQAGDYRIGGDDGQCCSEQCFTEGASCSVELFKHGNFAGWKATFTEGVYTISDFVARGATNDDASAIKVVGSGCVAEVYEHGDFTGWKATFAEGIYNHPAFVARGAINDHASAIKVYKTSQTSHEQYPSRATLTLDIPGLDFSPCPSSSGPVPTPGPPTNGYPTTDTRYCGRVEEYCNGRLGHGWKLKALFKDLPQMSFSQRKDYSKCLWENGHKPYAACGNSDYAIRPSYPNGCRSSRLLTVGICTAYCYDILPKMMDIEKEKVRLNKDDVLKYYCGNFHTTAYSEVRYTPSDQGQLWDSINFNKAPRSR